MIGACRSGAIAYDQVVIDLALRAGAGDAMEEIRQAGVARDRAAAAACQNLDAAVIILVTEVIIDHAVGVIGGEGYTSTHIVVAVITFDQDTDSTALKVYSVLLIGAIVAAPVADH